MEWAERALELERAKLATVETDAEHEIRKAKQEAEQVLCPPTTFCLKDERGTLPGAGFCAQSPLLECERLYASYIQGPQQACFGPGMPQANGSL